MSLFPMICKACGHHKEVQGTVGSVPVCRCETCGEAMQRSFRLEAGETGPLLNLGYREARYGTETDRNIAKYQFTNL